MWRRYAHFKTHFKSHKFFCVTEQRKSPKLNSLQIRFTVAGFVWIVERCFEPIIDGNCICYFTYNFSEIWGTVSVSAEDNFHALAIRNYAHIIWIHYLVGLMCCLRLVWCGVMLGMIFPKASPLHLRLHDVGASLLRQTSSTKWIIQFPRGKVEGS